MLYPNSNLKELEYSLEKVNQHNGIFVLATHYHSFEKRIKSGEKIKYALKKLLEKASKFEGIHFVSYKDIW